jgi:hypothetical protein
MREKDAAVCNNKPFSKSPSDQGKKRKKEHEEKRKRVSGTTWC